MGSTLLTRRTLLKPSDNGTYVAKPNPVAKAAPYTAAVYDHVLADATPEIHTGCSTNAASPTVLDPHITSAHAGRPVQDINVSNPPLPRFIANVVPGVSFDLHDASGNPVNAAATALAGIATMILGGNPQVTLPATPTLTGYVDVEKVDTSPFPVNVITSDGSKINGLASVALTSPNQRVRFQWTGTAWRIGTGSTVAQPASGVAMTVEATFKRLRIIAMDDAQPQGRAVGAANNTGNVLLSSDQDGRSLYITLDPNGQRIIPLTAFPAGSTIRQAWFLDDGSVIAHVTTSGTHNLYKGTLASFADGASDGAGGFSSATGNLSSLDIGQTLIVGGIRYTVTAFTPASGKVTLLGSPAAASGLTFQITGNHFSSWTITKAGFGNATTSNLQWNLAQFADGSVWYQEYDGTPSVDTYHLFKSTDHGATWTTAQTLVNPGYHVHGVFADPFHNSGNRLVRCIGDADNYDRVEYTDDAATTFTSILSGGQNARSVTFIPVDANTFITGYDSPGVTQDVTLWNWADGSANQVLIPNAGNTAYFGVLDPTTKRGLFGTATRTGTDLADVKLWGFYGDGRSPAIPLAVVQPLPATSRLDMPVYGPGPSGEFYFGVIHAETSGTTVSETYRVHLTDGPVATQYMKTPDSGVMSRRHKIEVGPHINSTTTAVVMPNAREIAQFFTATEQMSVARAVVKSAAAMTLFTNHLVIAIRECDASGTPQGALAISATVTINAAGTTFDTFTFEPRPVLVAGAGYAVTLESDSANVQLVGDPSGTGWSEQEMSRYQTAQPFPMAVAGPASWLNNDYGIPVMLSNE